MKSKLVRVLTLVAVLALAVSSFTPAAAQDTPTAERPLVTESPNGIYIVQLIEKPVVGYEGDLPNLKATKPGEGEKIDPESGDVSLYVDYLISRHDAALAEVGGEKIYDYTYAFNGFAARLSARQATRIAKMDGVIAVTPDEVHTVDTSSTPDFLGLTDPSGGLWADLDIKGEGVIIGIIDTGIWPDSLSFTDKVDGSGIPDPTGTVAYDAPTDWYGECITGEEFELADCNNKLIGARYYNAGYGGDTGINADLPWEYTSPRDFNGHGTHTSSTAGGNHGTPVTGGAAGIGASVSGMAPRAYIAMYKALWTLADGTGSGWNSDLTAAIDAAVEDGVDVINYSISGTRTNFVDPVEVSFLWAADAGIFVATSAGNSGPTSSTVAHPSPWITTVAAGTHNRNGEGSVTTGDATTYYGASFATALPGIPLVDSAAVPASGATAGDAELCTPGSLDAAAVTGKVVLCKRGTYALVDKSAEVADAGGVGMILYNASDTQNQLALLHSVPTVHINNTDGLAIKAYIASAATPNASIAQATIVFDVDAPYTASFSSRGPLLAGNGDLLKPDVIAPGQDILAAVAPPGNFNHEFDLYSGTSMSSPHVAGIAALFKEAYPDWEPSMIKSALMTSAYDVLDGPNTNPLVIFRQGAGHINPNSAIDPGLVFYSDLYDWYAFLCGTTNALPSSICSTLLGWGYSTDPSQYNGASIAIGALAGEETIVRYITSVGNLSETYTFSYEGLSGITVTPNAPSFTIDPGDTTTIDVTFTVEGTAALNAYIGGYITWTGDQGHVVRIPVVVKPVAFSAPTEVYSTGEPIDYDVTFGFTGPFTATPRGLVEPVIIEDEIYTDDFLGYGFSLPGGITYARFSLFDDYVDPASDLDLYLYSCDAGWICSSVIASSGGGTSEEEVNVVNPPAGNYAIFVDGYATADPSTFSLFAWILGSDDEGNMIITAPTDGVLGTTESINLTFSGLGPTKYLGSVAYSGTTGMPNPTIVRVDMEELVITSISPTQVQAGSADLTLTVTGTGFEDGDVVYWDMTALPTTFVSSTELEATIPAIGLAEVYWAQIRVVRPGYMSYPSNAKDFKVYTFGDVLPTHTHWRNIEGLYAMGITGGCTLSPLNYCPANTVTRQQMAIFLLRSMYGKEYVPPAATGIFTDVPLSSSYAPWIEALYAEGITGGCSLSPMKYCPSNSVTRGQMAIFLLRAKEGKTYVPPAATGVFTDVPLSSSTAPWIEDLYSRDITGGCSTSPLKYCPANPVTRAQMGTFIVRMFEFDPLPELP